jgi:transketolase
LCLVLSLAQLKARTAIDALLEGHPETILAGQEVDWQTGALACGMKHLFVATGR